MPTRRSPSATGRRPRSSPPPSTARRREAPCGPPLTDPPFGTMLRIYSHWDDRRATTMTTVGIIGSGYSGLTLALRLQQLGVSTTLYAEATPDAMRRARLANTVGRFPRTLERERLLGVDHWPATDAMAR